MPKVFLKISTIKTTIRRSFLAKVVFFSSMKSSTVRVSICHLIYPFALKLILLKMTFQRCKITGDNPASALHFTLLYLPFVYLPELLLYLVIKIYYPYSIRKSIPPLALITNWKNIFLSEFILGRKFVKARPINTWISIIIHSSYF